MTSTSVNAMHFDLAASVLALRNRNAPIGHYQQLTVPPLSEPIAQDVADGKLTFTKNPDNHIWYLTPA